MKGRINLKRRQFVIFCNFINYRKNNDKKYY